MKVICVDDEQMALNNILLTMEKMDEVDEAVGFTSPVECLEYLQNNSADIAFLDIRMREMDGLSLAKNIRELNKGVHIVFLTAYSEYALEAFKLRASGYIVKPASAEDVKIEIEHVKEFIPYVDKQKKIRVQTFGNFEVYVGDKPLFFPRNKSKELLAYLIDRRGAAVKMSEAGNILWDDGIYDRSRQKQMQVFVHDMIKTLKEYGVDDVVMKKRTGIMIDTNKVQCDYYDFLSGDVAAINSYYGEYMSNYSWGEMTLGYLNKEK